MSRLNSFKRSALALAVALATHQAAFAQSNTSGYIFGQAAGPGTVSVENLSTGLKRDIATDAEGNFRAAALPTGRYRVTHNGESREVNVNVGNGTEVSFAQDAAALDVVVVTGESVNPIDISSVESSSIFTEAQIDALPVARNVTGVALLAPGTTRGDTAFGNLASFGGSSVAENAYYINGFNVTNIYKGVAYAQLPFEGVAETQVKTGGYGAEFGRSTGGVINIITKRGGNEFKAGANLFWTPGALSEDSPDVHYADGDIYNRNSNESSEALSVSAYASGPIIEDRLFFFALVQSNQRDTESAGSVVNGRYYSNEGDDPLWLAKLDWNISDNHMIELTGFSDKRKDDTLVSFQDANNDRGTDIGTTANEEGGSNFIAKYTGYLSDSFTLSALYGVGKYKRQAISDNSCPLVVDLRDVANPVPGCWSETTEERPDGGDERVATRIDGEWILGDHQLRFGYDNEKWNTVGGARYSGGEYFQYTNVVPGQTVLGGAVVPAGVTEVVRRRVYENGGDVDVDQTAFYIEDTWQLTDNLLVYGGLRNESFDNKNPLGVSFTKIDNQIAPRLGLSWDVNGDSTLKVFGNAGRYYLPIAANTNVRAGGSELDYREWFAFSGIDPITGRPVLGQQIGTRQVTSNGTVPNPLSVADRGLDPMFQEEFIIGFQKELFGTWSGGVRAIHRDLKRAIDDFCDHRPIEAWADDNGFEYDGANVPTCMLFNPGNGFAASIDVDGDGDLEQVELSAEDLGFDPIKRKYNAIEFFFERPFDGKWFMQGSWTIAHSYGNTEGYVNSDIGQDDAGVTQAFDYPELMEGAYGNLPNDRRHTLKMFGAYKFNDQWQMGGNLLVQAGRPINCIGFYPDQNNEGASYGNSHFFCNGTLVPRGSVGRTPWQKTLDLNLEYRPEALAGKFAVKADVFNVFNAHTVTEVSETGEDAPGVAAAEYRLPTAFEAPRSVRLSVSYDF
jgi:hypothetical protein